MHRDVARRRQRRGERLVVGANFDLENRLAAKHDTSWHRHALGLQAQDIGDGDRSRTDRPTPAGAILSRPGFQANRDDVRPRPEDTLRVETVGDFHEHGASHHAGHETSRAGFFLVYRRANVGRIGGRFFKASRKVRKI